MEGNSFYRSHLFECDRTSAYVSCQSGSLHCCAVILSGAAIRTFASSTWYLLLGRSLHHPEILVNIQKNWAYRRVLLRIRLNLINNFQKQLRRTFHSISGSNARKLHIRYDSTLYMWMMTKWKLFTQRANWWSIRCISTYHLLYVKKANLPGSVFGGIRRIPEWHQIEGNYVRFWLVRP